MISNGRIGIFGGTFNPPHKGHLNSIMTVKNHLNLDKIFVVPAAQNPLKKSNSGPSNEQRLEMVELFVRGFEEDFSIDPQELDRGGESYTVETLESYLKNYEPEDIHLIIGMDQFEKFDHWKESQSILKNANLLVTSRPGSSFPTGPDELPECVQNLVEIYDYRFIELSTGRNIQFITLDDINISSTDLRKILRLGRNSDKYLTIEVEEYIKKEKLYQVSGPRVSDNREFTTFCANILFSKKAIDTQGYDLSNISGPSEMTLIASASSKRQAISLSEQVMEGVKEEYGLSPYGVEGLDEGVWVLIDFGSLIIHIFYDFTRSEYQLESLWKEGINLNLKDPADEPR